MRMKLLFVIMVVFLSGCGRKEESTALPTRAQSAVNGPRIIQDIPTPSLPPTWTPSPIPVVSTPIPDGSAIGVDTEDSSAASDQRTHVVQAGDTLGEIAAQYQVSLADLIDVNDIDNMDVIEVGTVLIIPGE